MCQFWCCIVYMNNTVGIAHETPVICMHHRQYRDVQLPPLEEFQQRGCPHSESSPFHFYEDKLPIVSNLTTDRAAFVRMEKNSTRRDHYPKVPGEDPYSISALFCSEPSGLKIRRTNPRLAEPVHQVIFHQNRGQSGDRRSFERVMM